MSRGFFNAAARLCLILSLTSVGQRKSIMADIFFGQLCEKSNYVAAMKNDVVLQVAVNSPLISAAGKVES